MFFVLFAFWIILNGQWTGEIAIVGLVLSALIYLLMWKFMNFSPKREWAIVKRLPRLIAYFFYLVGEIFKAAWGTIKFIWSPSEVVEPEVRSFRTRLKSGWAKVVLANSITLTPGTITVDVQDDVMLVHCIDRSFGEGLDDSEMEKRILRIEGEGRHEA